MFSILGDRTYRHLFMAQIVALLGTGLATIALGLLAFDLADERAALVLGTVFTIKMVAYVGIAPIAGAFVNLFPRRKVLVMLDIIRAAVALCLPFVTEIWQIYILIFVLQSASAAFTPTFQATIPDILPKEEDYTQALSLSRLAYDLENLISPALAAILLTVVSYHALFIGTSVGFIASAALVVSVILPTSKSTKVRGIYERTTRGMRIYLATPRLRGLLSLNFSAAAAGAMVLVNTVLIIQGKLELGVTEVAITLSAFGGGSMLAAIVLPRLLSKRPDRKIMLSGTAVIVTTLFGLAIYIETFGLNWSAILAGWFIIGLGYSTILTPSGRLLKRSAHSEDRPAIYAAQFALSHACWLITYPLAGWLITVSTPTITLLILAILATAGLVTGAWLWPYGDSRAMPHSHTDLPDDHPHLLGKHPHKHPIVIDDYHPQWPRRDGGNG